MGADTFNLSDAEQAFFATGELPDDLAEALGGHTAPVELETPDPKAEAVVEPPKPEVPVAPDALELMRRSLQEEQRLRADLEARLNAQIESSKPKPEPAPDENTDPLGAMMHKLNDVNKTVQELQTKLMEQRQAAEQQQQLNEFQTQMRNLRDEYVKTTPDFQAAYDHLRATRSEDMKALGATDAQIHQALMRDEIAIAQSSINQGKNPAAVMYEMSKRHGYVSTPPHPANPAAKPNSASKIDILQRGQSQSKTVAANPPHNDELSVETLRNASDADLNKLILDDKAWNKISGNSTLNDLFH